ncbi:MAG: phosphoglycolate phosphatase [Casimicrobiaceae bacterium]
MTSATKRAPFPVRAVLFDLDGTLADTAPDLGSALNRVRADLHLPPLPLAALRPFASHGARGMLRGAMGIEEGNSDYPVLRDRYLDYYGEALFVHTRLFDGADAMLAEIERRGLSWGIVTNKTARFTLPLLAHLGIAERAGAVICGDTTPHSKPHPAPLLAGAKLLTIDPVDCLYVGDAERDIVGGKAAGMKTMLARFGYLGPQDTPDKWQADASIDSLSALLDWLPN